MLADEAEGPTPDKIIIQSITSFTSGINESPITVGRLARDNYIVQQFFAQIQSSPDTGRRLAQLTGQRQGLTTQPHDYGGPSRSGSPNASETFRTDNIQRANIPSISHVQLKGSWESSCPIRCKCACHRRRRFTFGSQARLVGSLSFSIAGVSWFRPKCTLNTCRRAPNGGFAFQYTFPLWLMNRMLAAWVQGTPEEGGMRLKHYRVHRSDCIMFAEMGRVEEMRDLYQSHQAYINDADPADGETALMVRHALIGYLPFGS